MKTISFEDLATVTGGAKKFKLPKRGPGSIKDKPPCGAEDLLPGACFKLPKRGPGSVHDRPPPGAEDLL